MPTGPPAPSCVAWRSGSGWGRMWTCRGSSPTRTRGWRGRRCSRCPRPGRGSATCWSRRWRAAARWSAPTARAGRPRSWALAATARWCRSATPRPWPRRWRGCWTRRPIPPSSGGGRASSRSGARPTPISRRCSAMAENPAAFRVALLLPSLAGGGVERSTLALARGLLERGAAVDLLLGRAEGPLRDAVPAGVRVVPLRAAPGWQGRLGALRAHPGGVGALLRPVLLARAAPDGYRLVPALARYLQEVRPDALIAAFPFENLAAIAARRLAGVATRVIVTERTTTTAAPRRGRTWKRRYLPGLQRHAYPMADAIVAVSDGVADRLARKTGLPRAAIRTVHNPVVVPELPALVAA